MLRSLGPVEILVILGIVILLFGVGRIGKLGSEMGEAVSGFRNAMQGNDDSEEDGEKSETAE